LSKCGLLITIAKQDSSRIMFLCRAVILLAVLYFINAQPMTITWTPCSIYSDKYTYYEPRPVANITSECGSTTTNYYNDDPNSPILDLLLKRYRAKGVPQGTVVILGDQIIGSSGEMLDKTGYSLFNVLGQSFDVVMPGFRGIPTSNNSSFRGYIYCIKDTISTDQIGTINCQTPNSIYGTSYSGFSVDEIAKDNLKVIDAVKVLGKPLFVFGKSFGSYVVNRMLVINQSSIDAVIMDGVWGPLTNASDWDIQRNQMAENISQNFHSASQSIAYQQYSKYSQDFMGLFTGLVSTVTNVKPLCGQSFTVPLQNIIIEIGTASLFAPSLRPRILSSVLQLTRCNIYDFGSGNTTDFKPNVRIWVLH
jgi:hypothetical protein